MRDPSAIASAIRAAADPSAYGPGGHNPGIRADSPARMCGASADAIGRPLAVAVSHATIASPGGTPPTRSETSTAEPSIAQAQAEDRLQFERQGYFVADRYDHRPDRPVFNRTATLKDSFARKR